MEFLHLYTRKDLFQIKGLFWIPDVEGDNSMNISCKNIYIEQIITQLYPNSQLIAKINQEFNNQNNAVNVLRESLLNNWTSFDLFSKYFLIVLFQM